MSAAVLGLARGGHTVTLQQEPEHDPVRNEEERYDHGGNEIGSAQLTWVEPERNSPIVRVEEIRGAPHVEHPHTRDSHPTLQRHQGKKSQDHVNKIAIRGRNC